MILLHHPHPVLCQRSTLASLIVLLFRSSPSVFWLVKLLPLSSCLHPPTATQGWWPTYSCTFYVDSATFEVSFGQDAQLRPGYSLLCAWERPPGLLPLGNAYWHPQ